MEHLIIKLHKKVNNNIFELVNILGGSFSAEHGIGLIRKNEFKKYTNSKYAVTVSSCTAALHLSCLALNLKKGDEVIVPAMSHTATSHAVEYTGAKAVFVDTVQYFGDSGRTRIP